MDIAQRDRLKANVRDGERVRATGAHPYDAEVPLGIRHCAIGRPRREVLGDDCCSD